MGIWKESCEQAQQALWNQFFNSAEHILENHCPVREEEQVIYWWHAHALDVLLDGYLRTGDSKYRERFREELEGTIAKNGGTLLHNWYDDMEWMTLALIRAWDITRDEMIKKQIFVLWEDIKTAWNEHMGGGMAWKKDQLDYKNTPANAPAALIGFRLYQRFLREEDLEWGKKIFDWNRENLMDAATCFVWDGMNREGDGRIDYDWKFTYCQGVMIGAAVEYYNITGDHGLLELALQIAETAQKELCAEDGIFNQEGQNDCGLFRGIYFRYLYELIVSAENTGGLRVSLLRNAEMVREHMRGDGLIGGEWRSQAAGEVDLAQHLSGIMILEMAEKLG